MAKERLGSLKRDGSLHIVGEILENKARVERELILHHPCDSLEGVNMIKMTEDMIERTCASATDDYIYPVDRYLRPGDKLRVRLPLLKTEAFSGNSIYFRINIYNPDGSLFCHDTNDNKTNIDGTWWTSNNIEAYYIRPDWDLYSDLHGINGKYAIYEATFTMPETQSYFYFKEFIVNSYDDISQTIKVHCPWIGFDGARPSLDFINVEGNVYPNQEGLVVGPKCTDLAQAEANNWNLALSVLTGSTELIEFAPSFLKHPIWVYLGQRPTGITTGGWQYLSNTSLSSISFVEGQEYSIALYMYMTKRVTMNVSIRNGNGLDIVMDYVPWTPTEDEIGTWVLKHYTFTALSSGTGRVLYVTAAAINNLKYGISAPVICDGRSAILPDSPSTNATVNPSAELPLIPSKDFTLIYKFKSTMNWNENGLVNNVAIFKIRDKNTGKYINMHEYGGLADGFTKPWLGFDEFVAQGEDSVWHWHRSTKWEPEKSYAIIIRKSSIGTWSLSLFDCENNTLDPTNAVGWNVNSVAVSNSELINFSPDLFSVDANNIIFSSPNSSAGHVIEDIYYHHDVLTNAEVKNQIMGTQGLSLTPEGNFTPNKLKEAPCLRMDLGRALHFPLREDSWDSSGQFQAINPETVCFANGRAWTFKTSGYYNNQWIPPEDVTSFPVYSHKEDFKVSYSDDDNIIYRYDACGSDFAYVGFDIPVVANQRCYSEIEIFVSKDYDGEMAPGFKGEKSYEKDLIYDMSKKGTWQKLNGSQTVVTTTYTVARMLLYVTTNVYTPATKGYILFKNPLFLKDSSHGIPYNKGVSKPQSALQFNLHETFNLDWSSDWSIVYFKTPIGSSRPGELTGYSIDSIGCDNNTVGNSYNYWGRQTDVDSTAHDATPLNMTKYWGYERMISIRYLSSIHEITIIQYDLNNDGTKSIIKTTRNTLDLDDAWLTQYGFDLFLGGWDGTCCTSMYRDLIVARYWIPDSSLNELLNNFKNLDGLTIVRNEIVEKAPL